MFVLFALFGVLAAPALAVVGDDEVNGATPRMPFEKALVRARACMDAYGRGSAGAYIGRVVFHPYREWIYAGVKGANIRKDYFRAWEFEWREPSRDGNDVTGGGIKILVRENGSCEAVYG
jgi:hypothetical protein